MEFLKALPTLPARLACERGQTFVEYVGVIGFISLALLAVFAGFTLDLSPMIDALRDIVP